MNFGKDLFSSTLRRKATVGLSCVALLAFGVSAQAGVNLVTNGDFSANAGGGQLGFNTSATGWTVQNPGSSYDFLYNGLDEATGGVLGVDGPVGLWTNANAGNGFTSIPVGNSFVALDGDFQVGTLSQTITGLQSGDSYVLTFFWAASQQSGFDGPTVQSMSASLGAQTFTTGQYSLGSHAFSGWIPESFTFTASSGSEVLSFLAYGNVQLPPFALLDGVSLSQTPEPGYLAPGLGMLVLMAAGLLRSRKRAKA